MAFQVCQVAYFLYKQRHIRWFRLAVGSAVSVWSCFLVLHLPPKCGLGDLLSVVYYLILFFSWSNKSLSWRNWITLKSFTAGFQVISDVWEDCMHFSISCKSGLDTFFFLSNLLHNFENAGFSSVCQVMRVHISLKVYIYIYTHTMPLSVSYL